MNTRSASPADRLDTGGTGRILVWDAPVRVVHWLMVASFFGAYLTAESERWRLVHVTLGYTLAGLVVFRVLWGLVGTRHARFADFVRGPAAVLRYLRSLLTRAPEHHVGHNPAGALAIVALLGLALGVAATGFALYEQIGGDAFEDAHEALANAMLAVVFVHVAGVVVSSRLHRENLVAAMVSGRKDGPPDEGIRGAWRSLAALVIAAVVGFWWLQWQSAPAAGAAATVAEARDRGAAAAPGAPLRERKKRRHDDD